jgi:hypothetical protein
MNFPRWVFLLAWGIWGLWFIVWETLAVIDKGENETLSGVLKTLMWKDSGGPTVLAFVVAPLLVWLAYHFYTEVRTNWTT